MTRVILHLDMDAYFASVEAKANPALRGKPVLVVADPKRRSVVMTASYEARAFGVKTGMNLAEAKRLCPRALVVEGDGSKYHATTLELLDILESFTDQVEMASIDEAYLDVTGSLRLFQTDGEGLARRLQDRVRRELGLPCSVGVASNKFLAKLASGMDKPSGITVLESERVSRVLAGTPVEELCGVGPNLKAALNALGIRTAGELGEASPSALGGRFGFWGHILRRMGRGEDDSPVRRLGDVEPPKSVGHSHTLPRDTMDPDVLRSFLLLLSEKVAVRLRRGGWAARTVALTLRTAGFETASRHETLREPTDDGEILYRTSLRLLEKRWMPLEEPVRLLGVAASSLAPNAGLCYLLECLQSRRRLVETVDALNRKLGDFSVRPAAILTAERFGILPTPIPPHPTLPPPGRRTEREGNDHGEW